MWFSASEARINFPCSGPLCVYLHGCRYHLVIPVQETTDQPSPHHSPPTPPTPTTMAFETNSVEFIMASIFAVWAFISVRILRLRACALGSRSQLLAAVQLDLTAPLFAAPCPPAPLPAPCRGFPAGKTSQKQEPTKRSGAPCSTAQATTRERLSEEEGRGKLLSSPARSCCAACSPAPM